MDFGPNFFWRKVKDRYTQRTLPYRDDYLYIIDRRKKGDPSLSWEFWPTVAVNDFGEWGGYAPPIGKVQRLFFQKNGKKWDDATAREKLEFVRDRKLGGKVKWIMRNGLACNLFEQEALKYVPMILNIKRQPEIRY